MRTQKERQIDLEEKIFNAMMGEPDKEMLVNCLIDYAVSLVFHDSDSTQSAAKALNEYLEERIALRVAKINQEEEPSDERGFED